MDEQRFGDFIAERRKEKGWTQLMLAEKLHVTDKAVSKWERGAGFPDIKTLVPLAEALDVSLSELMNGKRIEAIPESKKTDAAVSNVIDLAVYQSDLHMRNMLIGIAVMAFLLVVIFLLDLKDGFGTFIFVCLPLLISLLGVALISIGLYRKKNAYKTRWYFIFGCILTLFPLEAYIFALVVVYTL